MGRDAYSRRAVLEYSYGLRIEDLKTWGILTGKPLRATWGGTITASAGVWDEELALYTATVNIADKVLLGTVNGFPYHSEESFISLEVVQDGRSCTGRHNLERQSVHFGGFRWFFRCGTCGRRCRALYFGRRSFGCRLCLGLVYQVSREHRNSEQFRRRAEKLEKRAGVLRERRHPRLANRLLWQANDLWQADENRLMQGFNRRFGGRASRLPSFR